MKRVAAFAAAVACLAIAACETTGDPRAGGLFGWSEDKAKARQQEKRDAVSHAESRLSRENERGAALDARRTGTEQRLSSAQAGNQRAEQLLRARRAVLIAKCDQLEAESPTAATASRARALRLKVSTVAENTSLPTSQRAARLRALEAAIDAARAQLKP